MNKELTAGRESGFKHAWAVLFAMNVIMCLLSLPYLLAGRSLEPKAMRVMDEASQVSPELAHFVRLLLRLVGLNWLTTGILAALIATTGFRRGDMWAWYAHWAVAAYWLGDSTLDKVAGGSGWRRGYIWAALRLHMGGSDDSDAPPVAAGSASKTHSHSKPGWVAEARADLPPECGRVLRSRKPPTTRWGGPKTTPGRVAAGPRVEHAVYVAQRNAPPSAWPLLLKERE